MGNRAALELLDDAVDDAVSDAIDAGCEPEHVEQILQVYAQLMREHAVDDD